MLFLLRPAIEVPSMSARPNVLPAVIIACASAPGIVLAQSSAPSPARDAPFTLTELADFDIPWAMEFLPDGRLLVSEQRGALKLYASDGALSDVAGVPEVAYGGQGGLGDVVLHPDFADNGLVYLSYAEPGSGDTRGAAV